MRKIFSFIILFVISQNLYAQIDLGLMAGYSSSNFKGQAPVNSIYTSRPGVYACIYLDWQLAEHFSLSFQPGFSTGGANIDHKDYSTGKYEDSIAVKTQELHIPVFFKIRAMNEKVYFLGGLDYTSVKSIIASNGISDEDLKEDVIGFNLHMVFGVGYTIPMKGSKLNFEIRYAQGLFNLINAESQTATVPRVKESSFKFLIGWQIPVIKK